MRQNIAILKKKEYMETRYVNLDLLRIIAMLSVVALHYLSKGELLADFNNKLTFNEHIAYILEAFSISGVNVFVLISGFFLCKQNFKIEKMVNIVMQVFYYTFLIPLILMVMGLVSAEKIGIYGFINNFFPIQMEHYWFISAYVYMYLAIPIINSAINSMNKKVLGYSIILLILAYSVPKTISPISITIDRQGYDTFWFICVYLIGAYIRIHGFSFFKNLKKSVIFYFATIFAIYLLIILTGLLYKKTGLLGDQILEVLNYNHLLNLVSSISLFYVFYFLKIKKTSITRFVSQLSPYVLGVYLLHEQMNLRYLWPQIAKVNYYGKSLFFIPHFVITILCIFSVGILFDVVRSVIFKFIISVINKASKGQVKKILNSIDTVLNHQEETACH